MSAARALASALSCAAIIALSASPVAALPTMIRLGYADCAACHLSPQGGGPLNEYGRGIDRAQSLRGGEYVPSASDVAKALSLGGRITQDLRTVLQEQGTWVTARPGATQFRSRLMYRNVTTLNDAFRVSAAVTAETDGAPRPALAYDPAAPPASVFVNSALLHYRATKTIELAVGRDQLPTGINVPDLALFIKSRNRLGYYDAPTQIKAFWNGTRIHLMPFGYVPGGNEPAGERESGAGVLGEVDVLGNQRTIVGVSFNRGTAEHGDRRTIGAYTRLGFGRWGILAEGDVTERTRDTADHAPFQQSAVYGQLFYAIREWLVASAIAEQLHVEQPFEERLTAGKLELAARLASQATVGVSARLQRDRITGRQGRAVAVQAAFKTVQ